jgi:hypothetical protein
MEAGWPWSSAGGVRFIIARPSEVLTMDWATGANRNKVDERYFLAQLMIDNGSVGNSEGAYDEGKDYMDNRCEMVAWLAHAHYS